MDTLIFDLKVTVQQADKKKEKKQTKLGNARMHTKCDKAEGTKRSTFKDKSKKVHIKFWYCNIYCAS